MNERIKHLLAFVMVVILVITAIPIGISTNAKAATNGHTQADAVAWASSKVGTIVGGSVECVAFVREYYSYLGYSVRGDGRDYESNVMDGWSRTYYYSGYVPQPGDIAVWRTTTYKNGTVNTYGHVAIVESANSSKMTILEQGASWGCVTRNSIGYGWYGELTCFIRPNFNTVVDTQIPYNMEITANRSVISIGETVTFNYSISGATTKYLGIDHAGGSRYATKEVSSDSGSTTYTFNEPGTYCCIIEGRNSLGYNCSHGVYITVIDTIPTDGKITADRSVISVGETVTFNYSISGATTKYLGIDHAGGSRYATKEVSSDSGSTTYTFNEPGTYCCIIEGFNSLGYNCSHGVYVTVIDTAPTDCKISVSESSKTLIPIGSTVTFNYAIRGASRICLGIDYAGGSRYDSKRVYNDEGTISYTFTKASTYCCIIEGWNNVGYNCSPGVYVTVFDPIFSIKFDANGGVCSTSSKNVSYGSTYGTLPTPNRSGYNFVGWYTKPSGGVKISASDTVSITGETTVYAHWIKNSETKAVVKDVKIEHNATVNYKSTCMLSPEITADKGAKYKVEYSTSNAKVATVDNNGKVYAAKKGNATITCTVTDSYGNVVTDKCNVNVDYSGAQWFIIIVLFGWIWYI